MDELDAVKVCIVNAAPSRQESVVSSTSSCRRSSAATLRERPHRDRRRERLNTELLGAASTGDLKAVIRLVEEGGSVNATCRESRTSALHAAATGGHNAVVEYLLARGARTKAVDRAGRMPVHLAAWHGHLTVLNLIYDKDPCSINRPVSRRNEDGFTEDLDSWNHDHRQTTESSCDFTEGSTPLHMASKRCYVSCVNFLLDAGASVDARDALGLTPLDVTGVNEAPPPTPNPIEEVSTGSTQSIDSVGSSTASQTIPPLISYDSVPLGLPIPLPKIKKLTKRRTVIIPIDPGLQKHAVTSTAKSLLERGAKMPKTQGKEGAIKNQPKTQVTALHTAVQNENLDLIWLLLEEEGCMMSWNEEGDTPLHIAVKGCLVGPLKSMLGWRNAPQGIIDIRDSGGRTLLHMAVMQEWSDGVSLLLEKGASVTTSNNLRENVFHLSASRGNHYILEELLSVPGASKVINDPDHLFLTPICKAVDTGSLECTRMLVDAGADAEVTLLGDLTMLHLAAENNFSDILDFLVNETSASSLLDRCGKTERGGMTALHSAALLGFAECVDVLLEAGADLKITTTDEPHMTSTALHLASRHGHEDVVAKILSHDSQVLHFRDGRGWYPLHVAASRGHARSVAAMIKAGADLSTSITDEKGTLLTGLEIIVYCVPQPLNFLVDIFNSYIVVNDYPVTDPNCEIEIKFDVLIPRQNSPKQLTVLNALLNSGKERLQEKLLLHPIVETFLYLKWMKLRLFFYIIMLFYLMFTFSLTGMALTYYVYTDISRVVPGIFNCMLLFSLIPIVATEALSVAQLQRYYVCDYESWVKWTVFACSLLVGVVDPLTNPWARHLTSVTVLLAWVELLFLVARCPNWGFYVLMFSRVAIKVLKVLVTFTFLLVGFTFAFMLQFNGAAPFSNLWTSLMKVFVMMLEFDYESTFENVNNDTFLAVMSRSLFLVFVVLVAIVLMNLMVGLAVSDIAVLETQGRTQRLAKQISFLSLLEMFVCSRRMMKILPQSAGDWLESRRSVMPSVVMRAGGSTCDGICLPRHIKNSIIERINSLKITASPLETVGDLLSRIERIESSIPNQGHLKDILRSQSMAIQEIQKNIQFLLSLHKVNKMNRSTNSLNIPNSNHALYVQKENDINSLHAPNFKI